MAIWVGHPRDQAVAVAVVGGGGEEFLRSMGRWGERERVRRQAGGESSSSVEHRKNDTVEAPAVPIRQAVRFGTRGRDE